MAGKRRRFSAEFKGSPRRPALRENRALAELTSQSDLSNLFDKVPFMVHNLGC